MSSIFSISSVTDAGIAAMQEALDHGYTLTFTSMKTGNGIYSTGEDVTGRTALKSLKNTYTIGSIEEDTDGATLSAVFTNYDGDNILVAEDYKINEIGLFCTVNSVEYLYALAAVPNDDGMEMPAYDVAAQNLTQFIQEWYVANSNDVDITVDASGAFIPVTDIVDNLTSTSTTQPLSANQGKVLKGITDDNTGAIEAIVNVYGSKNLLIQNAVSAAVVDGITITPNDDGSIRIVGTPVSSIGYIGVPLTYNVTYKAGTYILSGFPKVTEQDTGYLRVRNSDLTIQAIDVGQGATLTLTEDTVCYAELIIPNTMGAIDFTVYPMLRDARITDPTWAPFAKTNLELTRESIVESITSQIVIHSALTNGTIKAWRQGNLVYVYYSITTTNPVTGLYMLVASNLPKPTSGTVGILENEGVWKGTAYVDEDGVLKLHRVSDGFAEGVISYLAAN